MTLAMPGLFYNKLGQHIAGKEATISPSAGGPRKCQTFAQGMADISKLKSKFPTSENTLQAETRLAVAWKDVLKAVDLL